MTLQLGEPTFWGATEGGSLIGAVSGFRTDSQRYRSRGLWVSPAFRKMRIGSRLMNEVEKQARQEGCSLVWTMPRITAWPFYESYGFSRTGETTQFEFGPHILAEKSCT